MKRAWWTGGAAILVVVVAACSTGLAQSGTRDAEKIIDVASLKAELNNAAKPLCDHILASKLKQRFTEVAQLMQQGGADKKALAEALAGLQGEIQTFTGDWDKVTGPLWKGQETIGKAIDRVRQLLAGGQAGAPDSKAQVILDNYDKRLTVLAKGVQAEKDPLRKNRLKRVFANILALRQLTERLSGINVTPAKKAVYERMVRVLTALEDQLVQVTFDVEKIRVVLVGESQFLGQYVALLNNLAEVKELQDFMAGLQAESQGLSGLSAGLGQFKDVADAFSKLVESSGGKLMDEIESQMAKTAAGTTPPEELMGPDVDAAILKYTQTTVVSRKVVVD